MVDPDETVATDEMSTPAEPNANEGGEREGTKFDAAEAPGDDTDNTEPAEDDDNSKARAAPQAQLPEPEPFRQESMETVDSRSGLEDCNLTPVMDQNLKKHLPDGGGATLAAPSLHSNDHDGDPDPALDRPSALHCDEYSQYDDVHRPHHHESALEGVRSMTGWERQSPFDARQRKTRDQRGAGMGGKLQGGTKHSNPRKSPYRSEVARIRHAQRLERQGQGVHDHDAPPSPADNVSHTISLKQTTAPPPTSSFAVQSSRFKHAVLHSLGEFLTSAFADDEESSGSYFSQDLLDQLAASDPRLRGVWLQAKSLNDDHVRQLCEALVTNKVATEVWLPSNCITDVGAAHLAHMLKFNKSIRELFLGGNDIGPRGAAALASALARGNATLVALGLGDNRIGVEGAGALAAALRHNHSLHTLDVKGNGIPRRSSVRRLLAKMLEFNASDPGDESLVLGLQDELASLVSQLDPREAEAVVRQAEGALTAAMACRKRGDRVGAAEAEGAFIRICTTGAPPADPPEREGSGGGVVEAGTAAHEGEDQVRMEPTVVAAGEHREGKEGHVRDAPQVNNGSGIDESGSPQEDSGEDLEEEAADGADGLDASEEKGEGLPQEEGGAEREEQSDNGDGLGAGKDGTKEEEAADKPAAAGSSASQKEQE